MLGWSFPVIFPFYGCGIVGRVENLITEPQAFYFAFGYENIGFAWYSSYLA